MIGLLYSFDGLESEFEWCCWESEVYVIFNVVIVVAVEGFFIM